MVEVPFIKDPAKQELIQTIFDLVGDDFSFAYDMIAQITSEAVVLNFNELLQSVMPGGATVNGMADSTVMNSIANAINTVMQFLSPFVSVYAMILPILGIIKGILDVICALMNPFKVIKAVINLFKKYIIPFLALFPPIALALIILSIIKLILAVIYYIMTVLIPMIELMLNNIKILAGLNAKNSSGEPISSEERKQVIKEKLNALIIELLNKLGVLSVIKPILDFILSLSKISLGKPCKKVKKKSLQEALLPYTTDPVPDFDGGCCDSEEECPLCLNEPAKGMAKVYKAGFVGDLQQYRIKFFDDVTKLQETFKYTQNIEESLNRQTDDGVKFAQRTGDFDGTSTFRVKFSGNRGGANSFTVPLDLKIETNYNNILEPVKIYMISEDSRFVMFENSLIKFEIEPNWNAILMSGVVGMACHPDIREAKKEMDKIESDLSLEENLPELIIQPEFDDTVNLFMKKINNIKKNIEFVVNKDPPYDNEIEEINKNELDAINILKDFSKNLLSKLDSAIKKMININFSTFDVDKNIVKSDSIDFAVIKVIPVDSSGARLARQIPNGVNLDVDVLTNFGYLKNKRLDKNTGEFTFELYSSLPGIATITAKISDAFITETINGITDIKKIEVEFVSNALLPKRRLEYKDSIVSSGRPRVIEK